jgi:hypothetical protein
VGQTWNRSKGDGRRNEEGSRKDAKAQRGTGKEETAIVAWHSAFKNFAAFLCAFASLQEPIFFLLFISPALEHTGLLETCNPGLWDRNPLGILAAIVSNRRLSS